MPLLLIIALSFIGATVYKRFVDKAASATFITGLVFAPAVLYWLSTSSLAEFNAFGINAKFDRTVNQRVSSLGSSIDDLKIFSLGSNDPNFQTAAHFELCAQYYVVRPNKVPSEPKALEEYILFTTAAIKSALACGELIGVIVLNDDDRYIGSYPAVFFREALSMWAVPDGNTQIARDVLAKRIQTTTIFGAALKFPDKRITPGEGYVGAINRTATLREAFKSFYSNAFPFLVLTDELGKFQGIVTRYGVNDAIIGGLLNLLEREEPQS